MSRRTRYFVQYDGQDANEVTLEEFMAAERRAGFNGPAGRAATGGFGAPGVSGWIQFEWEETVSTPKEDTLQVPAWVAEELFETEHDVLDEDKDLLYGFVTIQKGENRRWSQRCKLVFTFNGRHWAINYELGLTENQSHEFPWAKNMWTGSAPEHVEARRVYPREVTIIEYH